MTLRLIKSARTLFSGHTRRHLRPRRGPEVPMPDPTGPVEGNGQALSANRLIFCCE
jgi:hypothetical protein